MTTESTPPILSQPTDAVALLPSERLGSHGGSLRRFTAHGVVLNAFFDIGIGVVGLARGLALAALLDRADFGLWGVLLASLGVLAQLKVIGISDKYVQQNEVDQERAFQHAFTLELLSSLVMMVLLCLAVPLVALVYGRWELLAPGLVMTTMLIAYAFQSPQWIHYRTMNFLTQRLQTAVEPVVGLIVAVGLALAGAGYWSLVIGALVGAIAGAVVAVVMSPYPLALVFDRASLSVYWGFSGPILVATLASVVLANAALLTTNAHLGLAAVGAVTLAGSVTAFTTKVDDTIATTIYPAICSIQDRVDLLCESFVKTNQLAMLWAIPFGVGLSLFAPQLIHYGLGERWRPAVPLLQITGALAALNHIGFNWDDYYRARSETRPIAVAAVIGAAATLAVAIPLIWVDGLRGLAIGLGVGASTSFIVRAVYVRALFGHLNLAAHGARAVLPVLPAVAGVVALRLITGSHSLGMVLVEFGVYLVLAGGLSLFGARRLLGEVVAIMRMRA
jgi:O-antigen/teichoic acid export membrane protein